MTNAQLADLLEEAARRLRAVEGISARWPGYARCGGTLLGFRRIH
jgi:hypothetical protein